MFKLLDRNQISEVEKAVEEVKSIRDLSEESDIRRRFVVLLAESNQTLENFK